MGPKQHCSQPTTLAMKVKMPGNNDNKMVASHPFQQVLMWLPFT
jgi:hypothetical protein